MFNVGILDTDVMNNMKLLKCLAQLDMNAVIFQNTEQVRQYFEFGANLDALLIRWPEFETNKEHLKKFMSNIKIKGFDSPIVLLSTFSQAKESDILVNDGAFELGALAVLFKPYKEDEVLRNMKAVQKIAQTRKQVKTAPRTKLFSFWERLKFAAC